MPLRKRQAEEDDEDASSDFENASLAPTADTSLLKPKSALADDAKIDHRKKRRNRTTQSCLSCHQNKRKCDRGRPCGRCITLGLTGFCVYEVGEKHRPKDSDEVTALRNRVAELEGVVRELKNKPQPRWAAQAAASQAQDAPASSNAGPQTPSFPKESWHIRSARKDTPARDDGENGGLSTEHKKKKRKLSDFGLPGDGYRVKMEGGSSLDDDPIAAGASSLVLGSPLFPSSMGAPLSPISPRAPNKYGPLGLSDQPGNTSGAGERSATDPYVPFLHQDLSGSAVAARRSLTGPLPSISSLSRRVVMPASTSTSSSPLSPPPSSSSSHHAHGSKAHHGPACPCLADPTATQFVAHLSRNVSSTVDFLETRHPRDGVNPPPQGQLNMHAADCGVMRALDALNRAIQASSSAPQDALDAAAGSRSRRGSANPLTPPQQHMQYLGAEDEEDMRIIDNMTATSSHSPDLADLHSMGMEMMDAPSPVDMLSAEALSALGSEQSHHQQQHHQMSNAGWGQHEATSHHHHHQPDASNFFGSNNSGSGAFEYSNLFGHVDDGMMFSQ